MTELTVIYIIALGSVFRETMIQHLLMEATRWPMSHNVLRNTKYCFLHLLGSIIVPPIILIIRNSTFNLMGRDWAHVNLNDSGPRVRLIGNRLENAVFIKAAGVIIFSHVPLSLLFRRRSPSTFLQTPHVFEDQTNVFTYIIRDFCVLLPSLDRVRCADRPINM